MRIYVLGSGAMGCRFGYQLHKTGKHEVVFIDEWQAHIDAVNQNGLQITGDTEDVLHLPMKRPEEVSGTADLIVLFTKAMQLRAMLEKSKHLISDTTKVVCFLNGLGHDKVLCDYIPKKNIVMGVTVWTAGMKEPGKVLLTGKGALDFSTLESGQEEVNREIEAVLNEAGLNATYNPDVFYAIWKKACVNGTMNATCALMDCVIGDFYGNDYGLSIVRHLLHEFVLVAAKEGVDLPEQEIYDYLVNLSKNVAGHYPSMHQDLIQNRRLTEIDYLNGAVAEKGRAYGIETPYCDMISKLIHVKELVLGNR